VTNQEISERATKALYMFENSKLKEISSYDLAVKVNECLRLIKALAEKNG
jgi:hypothetical protein